jgi:hypothetical protein
MINPSQRVDLSMPPGIGAWEPEPILPFSDDFAV